MADIQILNEGEDCDDDERGKRGKRGHRGPEGPTGPTGPSGAATLTGATGPTGPTSTSDNTFTTTRANLGPNMPVGSAVTQSTTVPNQAVLGNGATTATAYLTGLVMAAPDATTRVVQFIGLLVLTTAEWDAVTGDVGGLLEGEPYWLSTTTSGHLTTIKPAGVGTFAALVGVAIDATTMDIRLGVPLPN